MHNRPPETILVILGPTASGKSGLAMALARRIGAEILSVDSMQVYRGMNIGTAKPTPREQEEVRHHAINLVDPDEIFTTAKFVECADAAIIDARHRNIPLIAAGGTPLYYKALFQGMFEGPSADPQLRTELAALGPDALHARLREADAPAAQRIHRNDQRRMIRALEVYHLTGLPISQHQQQWESATTRHPALWVGLGWDREALNRRINARVKAMIAGGWVEEVRQLMTQYGHLSATAGEATGYRPLIEYAAGRISLDDAVERTKIDTRQLARRQMKWFRRFKDVHWIDASASIDDQLRQVMDLRALT